MTRSTVQAAEAPRQGAVSAVARAEAALARIAAYDAIQPSVWITRVEPDAVLATARAVDARLAAGEDLPLAGLTFAVKDNLDVAGLPTTAGCPAFAYVPAETAPVVARLLAAGAVLLGKTNLDQFATGLVGARSPYGALGCVFNRDYVSGGSSSGSAVAVAAGLVDFALGTDTAGSGRVPAAFNGLVGLKPTRGRWSTRGLVPACRTLDCVTVLARTVADAARVDAAAAGLDADDPFSRPSPVCRPVPAAFRFGVVRPGGAAGPLDPEAAALYADALGRLERLGGVAVEIDYTPLAEAAALLYQGPWVAERIAAAEPLLSSRPQTIHPVVRAILEAGRRFTAVDAFEGAYRLQALRRTAERMWQGVDVLALPTTPSAYRIRDVLAEPVALNSDLGRYTNFANLLDMAAVAVPAGFRASRVGFGLSLIGPAGSDAALMALSARFEETAPMPDATPSLDLAGIRQTVHLAVVGAHLAAMPLHWQLTSRDARLVRRCRTAPAYRLYAMADTTPPKPALVHVGEGGAAIEIEVYALDVAAFGSFVVEVPPPLAIGMVSLDDGAEVKGFVAEPRALAGAEDITALGGWRAYVAREADRAGAKEPSR